MAHWQIKLTIKLMFQSIRSIHEYFKKVFIYIYVLYSLIGIHETGMYLYLNTLCSIHPCLVCVCVCVCVSSTYKHKHRWCATVQVK